MFEQRFEPIGANLLTTKPIFQNPLFGVIRLSLMLPYLYQHPSINFSIGLIPAPFLHMKHIPSNPPSTTPPHNPARLITSFQLAIKLPRTGAFIDWPWWTNHHTDVFGWCPELIIPPPRVGTNVTGKQSWPMNQHLHSFINRPSIVVGYVSGKVTDECERGWLHNVHETFRIKGLWSFRANTLLG